MKAVEFSPVSESQITRAIVSEFAIEFEEYAESEVVVVGGGPSGLMAAKELATRGVKVLLVERNNYLGGGFWLGGFLMNKLTVRSPAESVLDELGVPYKEWNGKQSRGKQSRGKQRSGLFVADAAHACSKLIAATCDAGAKILNMTALDDVVLHGGKVSGVVVNWTAVSSLPREIACVDPVSLESRVVIDATGHDAVVVRKLEERGLVKTEGQGAMWVERSENLVVEKTSEFFPGLVVTGMVVSAAYGLPRMGPTFGAMLVSGQKAAEVAAEKLRL
ncbi:ribose 1,5-bisphosphate isomerase [ANME-1 cluster archaeon ex4572_4]|nr:MAG: ribose 1,5-bisphosphate isomerase [ANME-1 cluster archaeon ex4572_4]